MSVQLNGCGSAPKFDGIVYAGNRLLALSFFDRSLQDVKMFGASLQLAMINQHCETIYYDRKRLYAYNYDGCGKYVMSFTKQPGKKDAFYHAIIEYTGIGIDKEYVICAPEDVGKVTYNHLMEVGEWPLLPEWGDALYERLCKDRTLDCMEITCEYGVNSRMKEERIFDGLVCLHFADKSILPNLGLTLKSMISRHVISLSKDVIKQEPLKFKNLDDYYENYGTATVKNLESQMTPLTQLSGEIDGCALMSMRLYPQQISMVNAITALISGKKSAGKARYCFVNLGCGTGKTIISLASCEKYHVDKYLRENPHKSLADVYSDPDCINYRAVVLCPGHMVEKWVREAQTQVPFAKARAITEFNQLLDIRSQGKPHGREILVMSKDFAKFNYALQPVPSIKKCGEVRKKICDGCGKSYVNPGDICPECGHKGYHIDKRRSGLQYSAIGLMCPTCGNVLIPYHSVTQKTIENVASLGPQEFDNPRSDNMLCYWCGDKLWEPYVVNTELPWWCEQQGKRKEPNWKRISVFKNKKCDSTRSIWAHKRLQSGIIENALNSRPDCSGVRKYSPAQYIKRYLKGCVDMLIADECHIYKGTSGQGEAFNALCSVAKRTLCLTGTLTGGKAEDLFYTLYRLDPTRMNALGFSYTGSMDFSMRYGNVKKTKFFERGNDEGSDYSVSTRGRTTRTSQKVEPGISPLIFTEFLLDRAVFLDLDDMSSHLPELNEEVVSVPARTELEKKMLAGYYGVIDELKGIVKSDASEFGLMGQMLQFSLSWMDKPYTENYKAIVSPFTGDAVTIVPQFDEFRKVDFLSTKEKKLIELVRNELSEGRNCFIYLEYTNQIDTNISERLKDILEKELRERVEVLKSSSPEAIKREAYIRELAQQGVKVIITNPKCCETGVDFIFKGDDGKEYNYPTLIFYQMGYSLFTTQQASRRHYRLIQNRECRTYYMCWEGTAQEKVISIISKKMVAASAIQGHFSTEGLMSMAQGVDARLELARSLSVHDSTSGAKLQEMFDVLKEDRKAERSEGNWKPMSVVKDVIGEEKFGELFDNDPSDITENFDFGDGGSFETFDTGFDEDDFFAGSDEANDERTEPVKADVTFDGFDLF